MTQPLQAVPNSIVIAMLVVALIGFVDATYLTIEHFQNVIPPCTASFGCEEVLTSVYATVFGLPVALLGSLYYLAVSIGLFLYLDIKKPRFLEWTLFLTPFGFGASLVFLYIQAFVIHKYCLYCLGSALTSTILFVVGVYTLDTRKTIG